MKILVELIKNDSQCSRKHDVRYTILMGICEELEAKGHQVVALHKKGVKQKQFKLYDPRENKSVDFYICHGAYRGSKTRYDWFKNRTNLVVYEAGWLYNSLCVDRNKLFGDSYYYNRMEEVIDEGFDPHLASQFLQKTVSEQRSKWPQSSNQTIPDVDYIFIPGQVLHDASIEFYSKTGMLEFIEQTVNFAKQKGAHVVYKPHPGLIDNPIHGKRELESFTRNLAAKHKHFHIISTSIFNLMQKARFTACVNAGSMVDNMMTQTPVYACGRSLFSNSGAIICHPDVNKGLNTMWSIDYDQKKLKEQQLKVIWWLHRTLIQEHLGAKENVRRLELHAGVKF